MEKLRFQHTDQTRKTRDDRKKQQRYDEECGCSSGKEAGYPGPTRRKSAVIREDCREQQDKGKV
jgi:hypothetical protein